MAMIRWGLLMLAVILDRKEEVRTMYKIIVGEISRAGRQKWDIPNHNPCSLWNGKTLAASDCRISALSSADYCLRDRVDVDWGSIAWKGNDREIHRLFEAERLDKSGLESLEENKDYAVLFQGLCWTGCA